MPQTLTVIIPDDHVLIPINVYQDLLDSQREAIWWEMKDLKKRLSQCETWIKENILEQPRFKKILDVENGGFVFYPRPGTGEKWKFQASKMTEFLEENFSQIFSEKVS